MKTARLVILACLLCQVGLAQGVPGKIQWLQTNQPNYVAQANGVVADKSGNVIVVGAFKGSIDFGTGVIVGAGFWDMFIAKYTPQGALTWVKTFGNTGFDSANAVAIDSQTNIVVAGTFQGSVNLGVGTMTAQSATFNQDAFAAKFNPSGTCLWSTNWGSPATDTALGVAVDSSDNVIATSSSGGVVNFNNGTITGHGGTDVAIIKLSAASGTTIWGQLYGSTFNDTPNALTVDNNGNIYVTGLFNSTGGGTGDLGGVPLAGSTNTGIFLAKYSGSSGAFTWARIFGGNAGFGVATDPVLTNVFFTGGFAGFVDFGGGPISGAFGHSGAFFIASYDPSGNYRFAKAWGGNGDIGYSVAVNSNANLSLSGQSGGTIDWLGTGITMSGSGFLLANFTTAGAYQWAIRGNQNNPQSYAYGTAFDPSGRVLIAGTFYGTTDFGGITATAGLGDNNVFVAQYLPNQSGLIYYVRTDGNNANTGLANDSSHAWLTDSHAATVVVPGDTVITAPGFYPERVTCQTNGVTWLSAGTNDWSTAGATNWGFEGNSGVNSNYISGFYMHNTNAYGGGFANDRFSGVYIVGTGWIVTNCAIWECGIYGVNIDGRTNAGWGAVGANVIVNNRIWTNGLSSMNCAGTNNLILANDMGFNTRYTAFDTNPVCGSDGDGMYFFGSGQVIQSNYIHGVNFADPKNGPLCGDNGAHCDGIQSWGPVSNSRMGETHDCILANNLIDGTINGVMVCNGYGIFQEGCSNVYDINNVVRWHSGIRDGSSGEASYSMTDLNNTLIGQTNDAASSSTNAGGFKFIGGVAMSLGLCTNATWQNNIAYNWTNAQLTPGTTYSGLTSDHNLKFLATGNAPEDSSYTPFLPNDLENVNPLLSAVYANPPNAALLAGSPAINAGRSQAGVVTNDFLGVKRPQGATWDIGAFEFPSSGTGSVIVITGTVNLSGTVSLR